MAEKDFHISEKYNFRHALSTIKRPQLFKGDCHPVRNRPLYGWIALYKEILTFIPSYTFCTAIVTAKWGATVTCLTAGDRPPLFSP
jgi:hypothetical protein